jgi:hypothetical protein
MRPSPIQRSAECNADKSTTREQLQGRGTRAHLVATVCCTPDKGDYQGNIPSDVAGIIRA